jgi:hypothetical protein
MNEQERMNNMTIHEYNHKLDNLKTEPMTTYMWRHEFHFDMSHEEFLEKCRNIAVDSAMTYLKSELPYGQWTCADGCIVLFNRKYKPIWELLPSGTGRRADPDEWVPWIEEQHFYVEGGLMPIWEKMMHEVHAQKPRLSNVRSETEALEELAIVRERKTEE